MVNVDPWMLNPYFAKCEGINFHERVGEDALAAAVDTVLAKIRKNIKNMASKKSPS